MRLTTARRWLRWSRAEQWRHFLLLPLAGVDLSRPAWTVAWRVGRGVVACAAVLAFGYLLNAICDRTMDLDTRKNPLIEEQRGPFTLPLTALAVIASVLAATISGVALVAVLSSLACGWCYSAGLRLKSVPLVGTALNVGNFAPLLLLGVEGPQALPRLIPLIVGFSALLLQNQLLHEAADEVEDRGGGVITTYLALGPGPSAVVATLCALALMGSFWSSALAASISPGWFFVPSLGVALISPIALLRVRDATAKTARRWHRRASLVAGASLFLLSVYQTGA